MIRYLAFVVVAFSITFSAFANEGHKVVFLTGDEEYRYPISNPVAWTKTHNGGFNYGRIFTTTLGLPYDFKIPMMRRFALQGILWAMVREDLIPAEEVRTDTVGDYDPNNSGFGDQFKPGLKPADLNE